MAGPVASKNDGQRSSSPGGASSTSSAAQSANSACSYAFETTQTRQLLKKLEVKRQQLDEEIERFKIQKEREYLDYERELLEGVERENQKRMVNKAVLPTTSVSRSVWNWDDDDEDGVQWVEDATEEESPKLTRTAINGSAATSINGEAKETPLVNGQPKLNGVDRVKEGVLSVENATPPAHDRENDFRGLFTPTFLPLLASSDEKPSSIKSPPLKPVSPEQRPQISHATQTTPHRDAATATSTPTSRRSSSASDSASSLRAPPRTPPTPKSALKATTGRKREKSKSPKRVYFQLANAVVHPSSSYEEDEPTTFPSDTDEVDTTRDLTNNYYFPPIASPSVSRSSSHTDLQDAANSHEVHKYPPSIAQSHQNTSNLPHSRSGGRPAALTLHKNNSDISMLDLNTNASGSLYTPKSPRSPKVERNFGFGGSLRKDPPSPAQTSPKVLSEEELSESMGNGIFQLDDEFESGEAGYFDLGNTSRRSGRIDPSPLASSTSSSTQTRKSSTSSTAPNITIPITNNAMTSSRPSQHSFRRDHSSFHDHNLSTSYISDDDLSFGEPLTRSTSRRFGNPPPPTSDPVSSDMTNAIPAKKRNGEGNWNGNGNGSAMISASPHAGSVPIDIVRPMRLRDPDEGREQ